MLGGSRDGWLVMVVVGSDLWPPRLRESSASPGTLKMPESPPFSAPCFCTHTLVLAPIPH